MNDYTLDVCCGPRMMWPDTPASFTVFGDIRHDEIVVTDRSHGKTNGTRKVVIKPDIVMDFRAIPFASNQFGLVVYDPPHLERAGPRSWMAAKYGRLSSNWQSDLKQGFFECFRVLVPGGVLVFKWNETQVKVSKVLALAPQKPLFGQMSGRGGMTHWIVFRKTAVSQEVN